MDKKFVEAINVQLNFEIESAHVYLAMQNYFAGKSLKGFEHWFQIQYHEELEHAQKFMDYLNSRGEKVEIRGFETPRNDFESILEILEVSLNHEKEVTRRIYNLMSIAIDLKDYASINFLQWYVKEQVEEEANFQELIDKIKMTGGQGVLMLDHALAKRGK